MLPFMVNKDVYKTRIRFIAFALEWDRRKINKQTIG